MKEKQNIWLPLLLMLAFALTRWPGLLPFNFSAAYALAFCAGVFFPRKLAWWLPLVTLAVSDLCLNLYYASKGIDAFKWTMVFNYVAYAITIWLGTRFDPRTAWYKLVGGGILGAIVFYLVTNTIAWFLNPFNNPEYTRTLMGWIIALTKGTAGYPETWQFFSKTFLSGGLFTGLFVGAMRFAESQEAKEPETEEEEKPEAEPKPKEA